LKENTFDEQVKLLVAEIGHQGEVAENDVHRRAGRWTGPNEWMHEQEHEQKPQEHFSC